MFDQVLALSSLRQIRSALDTIAKRTNAVQSADDFVRTPAGTLLLDAVCMNLIALGEAVKGLDKLTHGELLAQYPEIYWSGVMRMRDKIAHHYFEVDADVVYNTLIENIPPMGVVIERMITALEEG